jgi:hypothetical protein
VCLELTKKNSGKPHPDTPLALALKKNAWELVRYFIKAGKFSKFSEERMRN